MSKRTPELSIMYQFGFLAAIAADNYPVNQKISQRKLYEMFQPEVLRNYQLAAFP